MYVISRFFYLSSDFFFRLILERQFPWSRNNLHGWDPRICSVLLLRVRRKMVASNTLQRYPETFDLAANAVNAALRGATVEGIDLFAKASWDRGWGRGWREWGTGWGGWGGRVGVSGVGRGGVGGWRAVVGDWEWGCGGVGLVGGVEGWRALVSHPSLLRRWGVLSLARRGRQERSPIIVYPRVKGVVSLLAGLLADLLAGFRAPLLACLRLPSRWLARLPSRSIAPSLLARLFVGSCWHACLLFPRPLARSLACSLARSHTHPVSPLLPSLVFFSLSVLLPRSLVQGSVWPPHPRTRFPCLDSSTGRVKNVLLPPLLLETAIALLGFHRADANLTPELKVSFGVLGCIMFVPFDLGWVGLGWVGLGWFC